MKRVFNLVISFILLVGMLPAGRAVGQTCLDSVVVTNIADSGVGSLREAIVDVCSGGTITFASSLSGSTITLTLQLTLDEDLIIDGSTLPSKVTISGNALTRVFWINSGKTVTLDSLIIAGGNADDGTSAGSSGGGIYNEGALTINNSLLFNNNASFVGGGIYNNGDLTIMHSVIEGNSADIGGGGVCNSSMDFLTLKDSTLASNSSSYGGGLYNEGQMTLSGSTLVGNEALFLGGGIYNTGTATVVNTTFTQNIAPTYGSGIYTSGEMSLYNSTLAGNSGSSTLANVESTGKLNFANTIIADTISSSDCYNGNNGEIVSNSHNLVEDGSCSAGAVNYVSGDPMLAALADNGGPTQTMALQLGSLAIDAGDDTTCSAGPLVGGVDQRGVARPQGTHCDIGAFELEFSYLWEQLPGGERQVPSYNGNTIAYDDFVLTQTQTIRQVEFWSSTADPGTIYFGYYENTTNGSGNDIPGTLISGYGSDSIVIEEDPTNCTQSYCTYRHSFRDDQTLGPGHYWIRIHSDAELYWSSAADISGNYAIVDDHGIATLVAGNLAFRLLEHVPPKINSIHINPTPSIPGMEIWASIYFSDPDSSSHSGVVDWGDGTVEDANNCSYGYCSFPDHTYAEAGTYTIQVWVTDGEGQTGTGSTQHEVTYVIAVEEEAQWLASNTLPTTLEIYGETLSGHTPLDFTIVTPPEKGSITDLTFIDCQQREWAEDLYTCRASVVYTPVYGDTGDYSFTFTVEDPQGNVSAPGTVRLWVRGNEAPTAIPGNAMVSAVIPKTISMHATDPDFYNLTIDRLSFFIDTSPTNGTLGPISSPECFLLYDEFDEPNGVTCTAEVLYTPNEGTAAVSDSFTFYVNDTHQNSDTATISLDLHHPTTLTVNQANDVVDANGCDDTHCSLREAVAAAELGDVVEFDLTLPTTITLSQEILIDKDMVINAPGADQLAVSGGGLEPDNPEGARVFSIGNYESKVNVTISGLTVRDGRASSGGGVHVDRGSTLTMNDCVIGPNNIVTFAGGGVFNNGGTLTLNRCTVTGNEGTGSLGGAGVTTAYDGATTTLINSTVSGNITNNYGGGLFVGNDCMVTLIHTTVSGNISNENYMDPGEERGGGAGIYIEPGDNLVYLQNSIIAGNNDMTNPATAKHEKWPDVFGNVTSLGGNIIGDPTGSTNDWDSTDQVGTADIPINPLLGALTVNEPGKTPTMALLEGSPAIDAALTCEVDIDQRGIDRPQGDLCDIGAYELEQEPVFWDVFLPLILAGGAGH